MRKHLSILFVLLFAFAAFGDADVTFVIKDATGTPITNRTVWITPISVVTTSGSATVIGDRYITNSGTGTFTVLNMVPSLYEVTVKAPPMNTTWRILVNTNTTGSVQASTLISTDQNATYPFGSVAYSVAASDARFALLTGSNVFTGSNYMGGAFVGDGASLTNVNVGPKFLGVVAVSLDHGANARGFGFKVSNDGTNWATLIQQAATVPSNACFAPALAHIGSTWIVTYDPYAVAIGPSNVWAQMVSSDLVNWTGPTFYTNSLIVPGSPIGGPRFFKDSNGVTYQFLTAWKSAPYNIWSVVLTNTADVNSWGKPALTIAGADDIGVVIGDDGRHYMAYGTLSVNIATNAGTTATNVYTQARSDVFGTGTAWESPQLFKLGPSNYIMFAQASPQGVYKTYYATATHPFGPWSAVQPINENGNAPSRMDIYALSADESRQVQGLVNSNSLANLYARRYVLETIDTTNATGPFLDFGGASAGRVRFDITACGADDGSTYGGMAAHFRYEVLFFQEKDGPLFPISEKFYDVSRPDPGVGVTISLSSTGNGANGAHGWNVARLMVYSPALFDLRWAVTEELEVIDNLAAVNSAGGFGIGVSIPSGGGPFGSTLGTYSIAETNWGIWSGNGNGLTNGNATTLFGSGTVPAARLPNLNGITSPGIAVTNGESQAITVSNQWRVDVTHALVASNATASKLAAFDAANQLTNATLGSGLSLSAGLVLSASGGGGATFDNSQFGSANSATSIISGVVLTNVTVRGDANSTNALYVEKGGVSITNGLGAVSVASGTITASAGIQFTNVNGAVSSQQSGISNYAGSYGNGLTFWTAHGGIVGKMVAGDNPNIAWGSGNFVSDDLGINDIISGGAGNAITNAGQAVIGGGNGNIISNFCSWSVIGGGKRNLIIGAAPVIAGLITGGISNLVSASGAAVIGNFGTNNVANSTLITGATVIGTNGPVHSTNVVQIASTDNRRALEVNQAVGKIFANVPLTAQGAFTNNGLTVINSGVFKDGGGIKHARVTTGSIAAGGDALVTVTWTTAFADANYTVQAQVQDATALDALNVIHIETVTASAVAVRVLNNDGSSHTGTLHVMAMHD